VSYSALRRREHRRDRLVAQMAGNIVGHLVGKRSIKEIASSAVEIAEAILVEIDQRREIYEAPVTKEK
jgi:hypothetical protein